MSVYRNKIYMYVWENSCCINGFMHEFNVKCSWHSCSNGFILQLFNCLLQLHEEVSKTVSMVEAASHSPSLLLSYPSLLPSILKGLQSPLSASALAALYLTLRHTSCPPQLADLVAHVSLRLQKPKCDLDVAWEQEDLRECFTWNLYII